MPARQRASLLGLGLGLALAATVLLPGPTHAFAPARQTISTASVGSASASSAFLGSGRFRVAITPNNRRTDGSSRSGASSSKTGLSMFLGQDSGILGVGAPEIVSLCMYIW